MVHALAVCGENSFGALFVLLAIVGQMPGGEGEQASTAETMATALSFFGSSSLADIYGNAMAERRRRLDAMGRPAALGRHWDVPGCGIDIESTRLSQPSRSSCASVTARETS